jgi:uncharacterized protein
MTFPLTRLALRRLPVTLAVCRLDPSEPQAPWMLHGRFSSVTRTPDERSVVCEAHLVPDGVRREGPFVAFMVEGPLDFALTGIVSRLSVALADAGIPIFVISTYDTDYVLVPASDADHVRDIWDLAGIAVG